MLKILTVPNTVLTSVSKPVKLFDARLKKLVADMEVTLNAQVDPQGVGLAASQIGENINLFIMKPDPEMAKITICINPTILSKPDVIKPRSAQLKIGSARGKKNKLEGCLSIPHIWSPIKRLPSILIEYQDLDGKKIKKLFRGFEAIIVQHEIDHLRGVLFTQRAMEQGSPVYEDDGDELKRITI